MPLNKRGEIMAYDNELYHYGVLGMKWGHRKYQNKDGSLTAKGKSKYYNGTGRITRAGIRARKQARSLREGGRNYSTGLAVGTAAFSAYMTHQKYKVGRGFAHNMGNIAITSQRLNGANPSKRKATAAAFIGVMGLMTVAEIRSVAKSAEKVGNNVLYKRDKEYKARVDAMASMKNTVSKNKKK